jgi:mannose/fructose/N-acetylgalactosamine-specific phosphotransferase system component IIB
MLGEEDVKTIRILMDKGVKIDVRCVPREKPINIRELLTMIGA